MTLRLDRAAFRRLVQLYIVTAIASTAAAVHDYLGPQWSAFSEAFDALVVTHFGDRTVPDPVMWASAAALVGAGLWMVASMFGLLRFQRWARTGMWMSIVIVLAVSQAAFGSQPSYTTPLTDLLALLDGALFGAILLLAYAEGYGAEWFAKSSDH